MKVVLFCGGEGMRMRDGPDALPKPMVRLGSQPILWHLMKYYAHFGHTDFVICLGYKKAAIVDYFLNYSECLSNDFIMSHGGKNIEILRKDIENWKITFVDTGLSSNVGTRLLKVRQFLEGEDRFLANYADGLTDCPLPDLIDFNDETGAVATFLAIRPHYSFHVTEFDDAGTVTAVRNLYDAGVRMNGGFFVLRGDIFDYLEPGEDLVNEPFRRLMAKRRVSAYSYEGFWRSIDTFKDLAQVERLLEAGDPPWQVWQESWPPAPRLQTSADPERPLQLVRK